MKLKAGDCVYTPRFCTVKIEEVFAGRKDAVRAGYCENTGYEADGIVVIGKVTGINRMVFAAYNKEEIFICPKCGNKTLVPMHQKPSALGIDYHDLCICEECGATLFAEPKHDGTVKFVDVE